MTSCFSFPKLHLRREPRVAWSTTGSIAYIRTRDYPSKRESTYDIAQYAVTPKYVEQTQERVTARLAILDYRIVTQIKTLQDGARQLAELQAERRSAFLQLLANCPIETQV
jgi:hypothetical protein